MMVTSPAPDFDLPATGGQRFRLSTAAKPLVIYFYPKDNTPGCTTESVQFRDHYAAFRALGCEVVGISRDSIKSHEGFKAKHALPFPLLSDADEVACNAYQVIKMKNLYGKQVRGIERSTFVIGRDGGIAAEWRGVKVPGHVEAVLAFVKGLAC